MSRLIALITLAAALCSCPLAAQTVFGLDGTVGEVRELSGPPDPLNCNYPDGLLKSVFTYTGSFACPLPGIVTPPGSEPIDGDIAVDRVNDTVWVTDGLDVAEYDASGQPLRAFSVPGSATNIGVTGMGYDSASKLLWMTDGRQFFALTPPSTPCGTPSLTVGPSPAPIFDPTGAPTDMTDIAFDPASGTLWGCDTNGWVGNFTTQGVLLRIFNALGTSFCTLGTPLLGLAIDTAQTSTSLIVTDGARAGIFDDQGGASPLTFGLTANCFSVAVAGTGVPLMGLGFSSRPVTFGSGSGGTTPPEIGSIGQSIIPNPNLKVTLTGATPGALAFLPFSTKPECPAIPVGPLGVLITPIPFRTMIQTVDGAGSVTLGTPIPLLATVGLEAYYQWFVIAGGPSPDGPPLTSSKAGSMRLGFR